VTIDEYMNEKPSILIVDDEERFLDSLKALLSDEFEVLSAANGKEGLRLLKSNSKIALILLDLDMPVMNGVEMLERLRKKNSNISVLVITGRSSHECAKRCADLNVQGYVEKPFDSQQLIERMKQLTGRHEKDLHTHLWGEDCESILNTFNPLVAEAIEVVDNEFQSLIGRDDIASMLKVSPEYLSRVFRQETGIHLTRYINERRVHESKKFLIKTKRVNISEVAVYSGIGDASYFTKIFKKHTGMTPKEYLKKSSSS